MNLEQVPAALLLSVSMAAALGGGIIKCHFCVRISDGPADRQAYNGVTSLAAAAVLLAWGGVSSASPFTLILGAAFGVMTALQQITSLKAMERGPWAYTSVIISLSTLIPALSGLLFWSERIFWPQAAGMALLVGCLVLSVDHKPDRKKASLQWLLYSLAAFVCTGMIGVMQKWHQSSDARAEMNAFLVVAFLVSFVYSAVSWGIGRRRNGAAAGKALRSWLPAGLLVGGGVCAALNNKLNLFLSGVMDSAVFFPLVNGGGLVLTAVAAVLLFRERLAPRQWAGLSLGILSVVFLCNPF